MNPPDAVERLKYAQWLLERNLAWIAQAEIKVAIVISIDVGMFSAVAAAYTTAQNKNLWAIVLSIAFGCLIVAALVCAAVVVKPNTDGPKTSFVFFGKVAGVDRTTFVQSLKEASEESLLLDLSAQVHRNAEIALAKHHWIRLAIVWSFMAAVFWIASISQLVR